jgi:hypothetical protein
MRKIYLFCNEGQRFSTFIQLDYDFVEMQQDLILRGRAQTRPPSNQRQPQDCLPLYVVWHSYLVPGGQAAHALEAKLKNTAVRIARFMGGNSGSPFQQSEIALPNVT